uniref:Ig-like domain-containing protein n=1 Tax=Hucho hucho TaxID=62062 RepID=A0A4W5K1I9_9TELE
MLVHVYFLFSIHHIIIMIFVVSCYKKTLDHSGPSLVSVPLCSGTPELYVDQQEVTGVEGGSVIVKCYYRNTGNRKWCKIRDSVQCVWENSGTTEGKSVTLQQSTDATRGNVLTVTMSGLKMDSTGWYRCGVGDLMMPVHITVRQQTTTQSTSTMTTTQSPTTEQPSFSPTAEPVQTEGGKEKDTMRWERTFFYLPKIGNAVLFLLCTIIAVVKFRAN